MIREILASQLMLVGVLGAVQITADTYRVRREEFVNSLLTPDDGEEHWLSEDLAQFVLNGATDRADALGKYADYTVKTVMNMLPYGGTRQQLTKLELQVVVLMVAHELANARKVSLRDFPNLVRDALPEFINNLLPAPSSNPLPDFYRPRDDEKVASPDEPLRRAIFECWLKRCQRRLAANFRDERQKLSEKLIHQFQGQDLSKKSEWGGVLMEMFGGEPCRMQTVKVAKYWIDKLIHENSKHAKWSVISSINYYLEYAESLEDLEARVSQDLNYAVNHQPSSNEVSDKGKDEPQDEKTNEAGTPPSSPRSRSPMDRLRLYFDYVCKDQRCKDDPKNGAEALLEVIEAYLDDNSNRNVLELINRVKDALEKPGNKGVYTGDVPTAADQARDAFITEFIELLPDPRVA